jgi:hypothetical protein
VELVCQRYESVDAIRKSGIWQSRLRGGRTVDDDDILGEVTQTLVRDVVDAVGGLAAAHGRLVAYMAQAQADYDQMVSQWGDGSDSEKSEFTLAFPGSLQDPSYALEEMIIWARTFDDRLSRPPQDRSYPRQGLYRRLLTVQGATP